MILQDQERRSRKEFFAGEARGRAGLFIFSKPDRVEWERELSQSDRMQPITGMFRHKSVVTSSPLHSLPPPPPPSPPPFLHPSTTAFDFSSYFISSKLSGAHWFCFGRNDVFTTFMLKNEK